MQASRKPPIIQEAAVHIRKGNLMKKRKQYSAEYISFLCGEIKLIIKAGISLNDAFRIMANEENDINLSEDLRIISEKLDYGESINDVLIESGRFPSYMTDMISFGYATGYMEEVFEGLETHYRTEAELRTRIRTAASYPLILSVMMLCVIGVLVVKVLPVFKNVFEQLGGEMSPLAEFLLDAGVFIGEHLWIPLAVCAAAAAGFAAAVLRSRRKGRMTVFMTGKVSRMAGAARFTSAIAMAASSGMSIEEAVDMSAAMEADSDISEQIAAIKKSIEEGNSISDAMKASGLYSDIYIRMIALGNSAGSLDTVLREISDRLNKTVNEKLDEAAGRIEPVLVIILSAVTGAVLLSVMLPLTDIMSTL